MSGRGGGVRAPISVGIQPQIALYSVILGTVCALAAYTEKYSRKEEDIDGRLKERYYADMMEQRAKIPAMTQTIREGGIQLDGAMNKWVWGGKASLPGAGGGFGGGRGHSNFDSATGEDSEGGPTESSRRASRVIDEDEDEDKEKELTKKERKRRRKERKRKRAELRKQKEEEDQLRLQETQKKLVFQSVIAGAAVGAVAVAASVMMGSSRK